MRHSIGWNNQIAKCQETLGIIYQQRQGQFALLHKRHIYKCISFKNKATLSQMHALKLEDFVSLGTQGFP